MIRVYIKPVPKPRMTKSDKWNERPCVVRYWNYKDELIEKLNGYVLPEYGWHITFYIPMPKSWSNKEKEKMNGEPHQKRPDKDNLEKAFLDALFKEDSKIWDGRVTKRWGYEGVITIEEGI